MCSIDLQQLQLNLFKIKSSEIIEKQFGLIILKYLECRLKISSKLKNKKKVRRVFIKYVNLRFSDHVKYLSNWIVFAETE